MSRRAKLALALCVSLAGTAALAYVMPSGSILRRMGERRESQKLNALEVTGTVVFPKAGAPEAGAALGMPTDREVQADARFALRLPGRCRLELSVPEGATAAAVSAHGKRRVEGKEISAVNQALTQVCALLAYRAPEESEGRRHLERYLKDDARVAQRQTSLSRMDGHVVYVVGPKDGNHLAVYKDRFDPARVRFEEGGAKWEVRFRDFGSAVTGDWFPRVVEVRRGGELLMRFTALNADGRAQLPDNLF